MILEFVTVASERADFDIAFDGEGEGEGEGVNEVSIDRKSSNVIVRVEPEYYRPAKFDVLLVDATKGRTKLGRHLRVTFQALVELMIDVDLRLEGVA